ncbi:MAG: class C sortase [Peptococcaceae bacterium]|jgi:sortase A|nr:class C sortase [Peptococcaceae bacterium]
MKKHLVTAAILLIFLAGLSVMLYPYVADSVNARRQSKVVTQYHKDVANLNEAAFAELFEAAHAYNQTLPGKSNRYKFSDRDREEYMGLLNPFGNSIMGTLTIELISVKLPIYHGTDESVLQVGAGHLEGSSLPVGGAGTHTVVTGHRGLPSSTLLTKLDKLKIGDTFELNVLNETLTYKIDQILVVEPHEMEELAIEAGEDYCTLVTCTPYGINSHRMLLRGCRTGQTAGTAAAVLSVIDEADRVDGKLIARLAFVPASLISIAYMVFRLKAIRRRKCAYGNR